MRKFALVTVLTVSMLTLAACGKKENNETAAPTQVESNANVNDATNPSKVTVDNCADLLTKIWDAEKDDDKFFTDGAITQDLSDAAVFDNITGFPAADIASIDDAAVLMHAMNANTFTGAAYHVTSGDIADLCKKFEDNINNRQWMCGMPEEVVVMQVGDYLISAFGFTDCIEPFINATQTAFPEATVISKFEVVIDDIF